VAVGCLIPVIAFYSLKALTPLDRVNRGAIAAHYGSTSLVTFTAALVFVENAGLAVEGYLPSLLAVMEVPGIIVGILLAKKSKAGGALGTALKEVLTSKSIVLLVGGIFIGLCQGGTILRASIRGLLDNLFASTGNPSGCQLQRNQRRGNRPVRVCVGVSGSRRSLWRSRCSGNWTWRGWRRCVWAFVRERVIHRGARGRETIASRSQTRALHHLKFGSDLPRQPVPGNSTAHLVLGLH
jgi:hypothetical protein